MGFTLKPMMIAPDAMARLTSVSVMAPTPLWMICISTASVESRLRASPIASRVPRASPLRMTLRVSLAVSPMRE